MNDSAVSLLPYFRIRSMLPAGSHVLVAVSGGADSMALLHLYTRMRQETGLTVSAATFDHGLRGEAGRSDAMFVEAMAAGWGVPCAVGAGGLAAESAGAEEKARTARYAFLAQAARNFGASYVATAHHADDQAETVLGNIIRGAGSRGLGGMRPRAPLPGAADLTLVRPLLDTTHDELVAYCRDNGIDWREDATNTDTRFRRNWIRHAVMPLLRQANPNVTGALTRLASAMAEQDEYVQHTVDALLADHAASGPDRVWIRREAFEAWPAALRKRALITAAARLRPDGEPSFDRIAAADDLLRAAEGGSADLGSGISVSVDSDWVCVARAGAPWSPPHPGPWIGDDGRVMSAEMLGAGGGPILHVPAGTRLMVRRRRPGDRVRLKGADGRTQKLKDWLINRKVPRQLRDHLPVVEADGAVVAVWDGAGWQVFDAERDGDTIEIRLTESLGKM